LLDINGDMNTDFLFLSNEEQPKIKVALGNDALSTNFTFRDFTDFLITPD